MELFLATHYNSMISYNSFYNLLDNDDKKKSHIPEMIWRKFSYDINFNALQLTFNTGYFPRKRLSFVWKNSIFIDDENVNRNTLIICNILNEWTFKQYFYQIMYWLDYSQIKRLFLIENKIHKRNYFILFNKFLPITSR